MAGLEHFQFGHHVGIADRDGHGFQMRRRIDEDGRTHVHAAHIEAADFGLERDNMLHALGRRSHRRARAGLLRVIGGRHEARSRPGGEIDDDVAAAAFDPVDDFSIERDVHAGPRRLGIAHVDVNDRRARLGGIDRGLGDLLGSHGHSRVPAWRVRRARHRARDHHHALHTALPGHRTPLAAEPSASRGPKPSDSQASGAKAATSIDAGLVEGGSISHQPAKMASPGSRWLASHCALR